MERLMPHLTKVMTDSKGNELKVGDPIKDRLGLVFKVTSIEKFNICAVGKTGTWWSTTGSSMTKIIRP